MNECPELFFPEEQLPCLLREVDELYTVLFDQDESLDSLDTLYNLLYVYMDTRYAGFTEQRKDAVRVIFPLFKFLSTLKALPKGGTSCQN